jgi:hypothetical protein
MKTSEFLTRALKQEIPLLKEEKLPHGFTETIDMMFSDGNILLDRERFNILTSYWNLPPINDAFYTRYFNGTVVSIEHFKKGLDQFIIEALWHFGDLKRAYLVLCELEDITGYFDVHSFNVKEFKDRLPWPLVEPIVHSDRGFLGYVSGQRPKQQQELLGFVEKVISEIEDNKKEYANLQVEDVTSLVLKRLSSDNPDLKKKLDDFNQLSGISNLDLFSAAALEQTKSTIIDFKKQINETIKKIEKLKERGRKNQEHYLRNIESIDVYVATSMRNDEEYLDMFHFVTATFSDELVKSLNLRYFDPTLCFCDSRIDKGIIECLLVRSTKVTIYCAQEGDTFGKDSELAATMSQGKPVIVYVPTAKITDADIALVPDENERQELLAKKLLRLESRAKTFKEFHPLGLQVGLYDGVARGVIVVRTPEQCASILFKILTNSLEVKASYEEHGLVLREKETNSVVRVMTGWGVLANCFWNQFSKTQNPKAGLPPEATKERL